jgi:site-specific DNA-methyltransferase (cytosine-N4-specific)
LELHRVQYFTHPQPLSLPSVNVANGMARITSTVVTGNVLDVLPNIPDGLVRTVITSPPYWSLRDYAIPGQIGLETDPRDYIATLVHVFTEIRRILADDGSLWLIIGDSYTSGGRTWRAPDKKNPVRAMNTRPPTPEGLKPKDLVGIPWRLAFALQESGWYLRSDVIWRKPNAMPESVKDRPTRSHEYLFLLTKSEQYFYNNKAVRELSNGNLRSVWDFRAINKENPQSVWDINTYPLPEAHFATFPPALAERCLLLSSQQNDIVCDPFFGSGTVGVVAIKQSRAFLGIDINPAYVNIARRRIGDLDNDLINRIEEVV